MYNFRKFFYIAVLDASPALLNVQDEVGYMPLQKAASGGHKAMVQFLLNGNA